MHLNIGRTAKQGVSKEDKFSEGYFENVAVVFMSEGDMGEMGVMEGEPVEVVTKFGSTVVRCGRGVVPVRVEILEKVENPLLQRTEVKFKVDHPGAPTPRRADVRAQLAAQMGVDEDLVVVGRVVSAYGWQVALGVARVYRSREQLEGIEPEYLLKRSTPKG